ncbi:MAG: LysM peptidoglycan-binding domain-containing protein [Anaerolineae bacterium]
MRHSPFIARRWLTISLFALLFLSACERPIPREDLPQATEVPPTAPILLPTVPPVTEPTATPESVESDTGASETETQPPPSEETAAEATPEPAPEENAPAETTQTETTHVVQAGETLARIAQQYSVTVDAIAAANNIVNVHSISAGQTLIIPAPGAETAAPTEGERTYVVRPGDNLFRIGLAYGFTVDEMASYNGITDPNSLEVGQVIRIPPSNN